MPTFSSSLSQLYGSPVDAWKDGWAVLRARWYLRHASHLGNKVRVWGRPTINNWGQLFVNDRVRVVSTIATTELVTMELGTLEIGAGTYINYGTAIAAVQHVSIGANCSIGTHVIIMDSSFHRVEPERRNEAPEPAPVVLQSNVWLGARVIVLPGVTIGAGSVIGAGGVVTKDIPPRSVAVGNPARVIRDL